MTMIQVKPIPAFSDNYIWCLIDQGGHKAAVVDPGDSEAVITALNKWNLQLEAIIITHHHMDHTGGIDGLLSSYSPQQIPVYGPENPNISQITHRLSEQMTFQLFGISFTTLAVPGHTLDHIALFAEQSPLGPIVFCGDTLFAGGCGRLFEGTPEMMLNSLNRLATLPDITKVYCAHEYTLANLDFARQVEPKNSLLIERIKEDQSKRNQKLPTLPSTINLELATNPFLRSSEQAVIEAANSHSDTKLINSTEVFAAIRKWKDNY